MKKTTVRFEHSDINLNESISNVMKAMAYWVILMPELTYEMGNIAKCSSNTTTSDLD